MKNIMLFIVGIICMISCGRSQSESQPPAKISPLQIGDTIPDIAFQHMLNYKDATAKLSDFRGKAVLLDFFGTWCGSCIWGLPKLDCLQTQLQNKVKILLVDNYESPKRIARFLKDNPTGKKFNLTAIASDTLLNQYFPYSSLPHEVWITPSGAVAAITSSRYVNRKNLEILAAGGKLDLPLKKYVKITFDRDKPLLENGNGGGIEHLLYRSTLTSYLPGVFTGGGYTINGDSTIKRIYYVNSPLLSLYNSALHFPKNRIILKVKDTSRYLEGDANHDEWYKAHTYCYEVYLPVNTKKSTLSNWMVNDLNRWFGLNGRIEKRQVHCWALVCTEKHNSLLKTKGGEGKIQLAKRYTVKVLKNKPLSIFVSVLNNYREPIGQPIFIDETGITHNVDITLKVKDIHNIPAMKKALRPYGLDLRKVTRELEMFVLSEKEK